MAENYKHLYHQMKKMVEQYQDEIVPGLRELLEKRVEVVRCKDCCHFDAEVGENWCEVFYDDTMPEDFAATEKGKTMRLIDADALSESIKSGSGTELQKFFADVCVATAPTIDAVPVVHGRWEQKDLFARYHWMHNCSICGNPVYDKIKPYNYCPNCGAKMDGDGKI